MSANNNDECVVELHMENCAEAQRIDGFGASDCWSMQYVGLWPADKRRKIADWLFSKEVDETGNPKGIGLSVWRFNIGAGSKYQGEESEIASLWQRTESFLQQNGEYNWNAQLGQRRFLSLAKERGVDCFVAFSNSPNVRFTANGLATNTGRGGTLNLKKDCLGRFVGDLANILQGLEQKEGIHISYISPLNEPDGHWNWVGPKQEGTPASKFEVADVVRALGHELSARGITTEIIAPESSDYRCLFATHMTDASRGYQIQSYFCPDSISTYIKDTPNFSGIIAGHSYWTTSNVAELKNYRVALCDTLKKYGAKFWQTEYCIMGNDMEIGGGNGYDYSMKTALYVARIIHHDLVYANASSWQWWRAAGGNYKDGLIRIFPDKTLVDGGFKDSKLLWALGNFSRFILPGAKRLNVEYTDPEGLMLTTYRNSDGSRVIVAVNYADGNRYIKCSDSRDKWKQYVTSDATTDNLCYKGEVQLTEATAIAGRSISTFVSF